MKGDIHCGRLTAFVDCIYFPGKIFNHGFCQLLPGLGIIFFQKQVAEHFVAGAGFVVGAGIKGFHIQIF